MEREARPKPYATHGYLLPPPSRLNSQRARGPWADAHGYVLSPPWRLSGTPGWRPGDDHWNKHPASEQCLDFGESGEAAVDPGLGSKPLLQTLPI